MELVVISAYAYGYYSESEYAEEIAITKETYNKVEKEIESLEFNVYDLDGKHSSIGVDIEIEKLQNEEKIASYGFEASDRGDLYYELQTILEKENINIDTEIIKVDEYLATVDKLITLEITVKESQKDQVLEYIKSITNV